MTSVSEYVESRELLTHLTLRELRGKYKRSVLGWAWSLLNPLATMAIFTVVFRYFFKVQAPEGHGGLKNYALFLLCGILPWNFLTNSIFGSLGTLIGNGNLIKKTYFPRELLVFSQVLSFDVSLLLELGLLAVTLLIVGNMLLPFLPVVIVLILLLTVFAAGFSLALSVANVYFRDVQHLLGIVFQAWFYLTPVVYPISLVPEKAHLFGRLVPVRRIYDLNPMVRVVEAFRDCMYDLRLPSAADLAYVLGAAVVAFFFGLLIFGRLEGRLAEEL